MQRSSVPHIPAFALAALAAATVLAPAVPAQAARDGYWSGSGYGSTGRVSVSFTKKGSRIYHFRTSTARLECVGVSGTNYGDMREPLTVGRARINGRTFLGRHKEYSGSIWLATTTLWGTFGSNRSAHGTIDKENTCDAAFKWRASWRHG